MPDLYRVKVTYEGNRSHVQYMTPTEYKKYKKNEGTGYLKKVQRTDRKIYSTK